MTTLDVIKGGNGQNSLTENQSTESHVSKNTSQMEESSIDKVAQTEEATDNFQEEATEPMIKEMDWSDSMKK